MKAASSEKTDNFYLLVASTEKELTELRSQFDDHPGIALLCCGVGPVEAAYSLTRFLADRGDKKPSGVINFGIGGAYPGTSVNVLDLCLATGEVLADLGVGDSRSVDFLLDPSLNIKQEFSLDRQPLFTRVVNSLTQANIFFHRGNFVTLNCASATEARGELFHQKHQAICENMEGGALARVCQGFAVDFLELRVISNMVEDRVTGGKWFIDEACEIGGRYLGRLMLDLLEEGF